MAVTVWQKPIINSVLLPAHAQPSGNTTADPANPSGQAGESGQVGQTEQGQTEQGQTNQEQTTIPQQNEQEQQQNPGEPNHNRLDELPALGRSNTGLGGPVHSRVAIGDPGECGTIQIVSYGFSDRFIATHDHDDRPLPKSKQFEKNAYIKITGISGPIRDDGETRRGSLPLVLLANVFSFGDRVQLAARIPGNAQPARLSGAFTAFFDNWNPRTNAPLSQSELDNSVLRCG